MTGGPEQLIVKGPAEELEQLVEVLRDGGIVKAPSRKTIGGKRSTVVSLVSGRRTTGGGSRGSPNYIVNRGRKRAGKNARSQVTDECTPEARAARQEAQRAELDRLAAQLSPAMLRRYHAENCLPDEFWTKHGTPREG